MIIDTTLFNVEFDMLDIRLALTDNYVDHWIICEANRTLSGLPKPCHLSEHIHRYQKYSSRMTVMQLDIPASWSNWDIENGQRAHIRHGYAHMASDNDVIMHSDIDEILNAELVPDILSMLETEDRPITCKLEMYLRHFDQRLERGWQGTVVAKQRHFQDPCTLYKGPRAGVGHAQKKKDRSHCANFPQSAGWHWGWMGTDDAIKTKVQSCIETQHRDADEVLAQLAKGDTGNAINHKCVTRFVQPDYPASVMAVIRKYPWWTKY